VEYFIYLFDNEYIKLIENIIIITAVTNWPPGVVALMPTRQDVDRIETLIVALELFDNISKEIQTKAGTERQRLCDVRAMFDGLISDFERHANVELRKPLNHLRKNAAIVNNPDFENGIVNIQLGERLSPAEAEAVKMFKRPTVVENIEELSYAEQCKRKGKQQKTSEYFCADHVLCDSNVCERSFSRARHFMHVNIWPQRVSSCYYFSIATKTFGTTLPLSTKQLHGRLKKMLLLLLLLRAAAVATAAHVAEENNEDDDENL
jgi:hypothetical protein